MSLYFYYFVELLTLVALPIYVIGIIYCAFAAADHEIGWFNGLFLAIFFSPIVALICIFSSPMKVETWRQNKLIEQNDAIIKLLTEREHINDPV